MSPTTKRSPDRFLVGIGEDDVTVGTHATIRDDSVELTLELVRVRPATVLEVRRRPAMSSIVEQHAEAVRRYEEAIGRERPLELAGADLYTGAILSVRVLDEVSGKERWFKREGLLVDKLPEDGLWLRPGGTPSWDKLIESAAPKMRKRHHDGPLEELFFGLNDDVRLLLGERQIDARTVESDPSFDPRVRR